MNQLGIIYRLTASEQGKGFDAYLLELNKSLDGGWSHATVVDERDLWAAVGMEANRAIAVTTLKTGIILTASRLTHGQRPTDNMTIWVYIPSTLIVAPQQWAMIISEMERIVSLSTLPTMDSFSGLVAMDFATRKYPLELTPSDISISNRRVAFRVVQGINGMISALDSIDQPYYAPYKHIILYPANPVGLQVAMDNLTNKAIVKKTMAYPPAPNVVAELFGLSDVTLHYEGKPFVRPISVSSNVFELEAHRPGYCPQKVSATVAGTDQPVILSVSRQPWDLKISRGLMNIVDSNGRKIDGAVEVLINNTPLRANEAIRIPERESGSIRVRIKGGGYKEFNETVPFSRFSQNFVLSGGGDSASTTLYVYNTNDKEVRLNVTVTGDDLRSVKDEKLTLSLSNGRLNKAQDSFSRGLLFGIVGTVVTLLIGAGIYWGIVSIFGSDETPVAEQSLQQPAEPATDLGKPASNDATDSSDRLDESKKDEAMNYLNNLPRNSNGKEFVESEEMNRLGLGNVYEWINTYDDNELSNSIYASTNTVQRIVDAIRKARQAGLEPVGPYATDGTIMLDGYFEKLNPKAPEQPKEIKKTTVKKDSSNPKKGNTSKTDTEPKQTPTTVPEKKGPGNKAV